MRHFLAAVSNTTIYAVWPWNPSAIKDNMARIKCGVVAVALAGILAATGAPPVDEDKPFGRVSIGVVTEQQEQPLSAGSKPGPNTSIIVHAEANDHCQLLIFALDARTGKIVHDWRPQFIDLPQWEEVQLPEESAPWNWSQAQGPINIYVLFLHPSSKECHELKALMSAMLNPNVSREVLDRQSLKLRELATRSCAREGEIVHVAKVKRVQVAATYRGANFPWRAYASAANFSEAKAGLLIFALGDLEPAGSERGFSP
jgi:hypothetical protein